MHPRIYTLQEHCIRKENIDHDALWAISELKRHGHTAYIVGGSVRDLLLGKTPKDFDISTSAKPEEIKKIFQRRCLIIGRRFRLAHLRFGDKIIETSTFRSGDTQNDGLITRDNSWGTEEEDVFRRDFTMNALYYDPECEILVDYVDGVSDISKRLIRTIGDPVVRFRQDPVRMLRMLKFLARFDLVPEETALQALELAREEIIKSAPARIYEEIMKMMESGYSKVFFELLEKHGFLELLLPLYSRYLKSDTGSIFYTYLQTIDHMIASGYKSSFDRSTYLCTLLFPVIEHEILEATRNEKSSLKMGHVLHLLELSLQEFSTSSFPHFPKKILSQAASLLVHQFRITPLRGGAKFSLRFPSDEEFRNALAVLSLRASIDHELIPLWDAWKTEYETRAKHGKDHHVTERPHDSSAYHHHHHAKEHRFPSRRRRRRRYHSPRPNEGTS